jgi:hypothetical protein
VRTGVIADRTISIYAKTNYGDGTLIGAQNSSDTNSAYVVSGNGGMEYVRVLFSSGQSTYDRIDKYPYYELDLSYQNLALQFDGNTTNLKVSCVGTTTNLEFFIFARNVDGNANMYSKRKLYNLKLYQNDIIIRDFIPCYRKSDNVIGLYDLVNQMFYTNAGTGTFLKGGEINVL